MRLQLIAIFRLSLAALDSAMSQECILCPHSDITEPGKVLNLSSVITCGTLNSTIGLFFTDGDLKCKQLQGLSSICGCATPDNACNLCPNDQTLGSPDRELAFFADQFGFTPTCEILDAYLKGNVNASSGRCSSSQSFLGEYCGCGSALLNTSVAPTTPTSMCTLCPSGESVPLPEKDLNIPSLPIKTCKNLALAVNTLYEATSKTCSAFQSISALCGCSLPLQDTNPCSLCSDGSKSPTPNGTVPPLSSLFLGLTPTCEVVEAYGQSISNEAASCSGLQLFGSYCSCPPDIQSCQDRLLPTCPNNVVPETRQEKELQEFAFAFAEIGFTPTCTDVFGFLSGQIPGDTLLCYYIRKASFLCGCGPPFTSLLGLDTESKQKTAIWLYRMSCFLSMLGSSWIIYDSLSKKKKRATTYHQLMVFMSIFDLFGSIGEIFGPLLIPVYNQYGDMSGAFGARGNDASCTAQGFFTQLGEGTAIFYNIALSAYYQLTIIHSWKEWQFKKHRLWIHVPPLVMGSALAFGAIPFYGNDYLTCWLPRTPKWVLNVFGLVPVSVVIVFVTASMVRVTWFVERTNRKNQKWKKGTGGGRGALVSEVRWQSIFYVAAFFLSWPFILTSWSLSDETGMRLDNTGGMIYFYFFGFFAPLQGFSSKYNRRAPI